MAVETNTAAVVFHLTAGGGGRFLQFVSEHDSGGDGKVEHCGQNRTAQAHPQ